MGPKSILEERKKRMHLKSVKQLSKKICKAKEDSKQRQYKAAPVLRSGNYMSLTNDMMEFPISPTKVQTKTYLVVHIHTRNLYEVSVLISITKTKHTLIHEEIEQGVFNIQTRITNPQTTKVHTQRKRRTEGGKGQVIEISESWLRRHLHSPDEEIQRLRRPCPVHVHLSH
jgi:hypothetical protein